MQCNIKKHPSSIVKFDYLPKKVFFVTLFLVTPGLKMTENKFKILFQD